MIKVERLQFPLTPAHAITIHKSQGSTLEYMQGDMNDATKGGKRSNSVAAGMFYTLLSRAKSRDKVQLLNFEEKHINVNTAAVQEMQRMRKECKLSCIHPLTEMNGNNMCLFNIRSWNAHIEHFLSDKVYASNSCVFCFTETHVNNSDPDNNIEQYQQGWTGIHKATDHGLAICYDSSKVSIIQQYETSTTLQLLPVLMNIQAEHVLVVLLYLPPQSPTLPFIQQLTFQLNSLPTKEYRTLIVGDFNMDQMLPENKRLLDTALPQFTQRSHYSTHIYGGILDLVFDTQKSETVQWVHSTYSDHFVLLIDL